MRRVSEWWIDTVQVPVRAAKVALEHLALVAARQTTLYAKDRLVALENFGVVGPLIPVATAFRTTLC